MDLMARSIAFGAAALCAATMGYAIQRGATCTVAAVDEIVTQRGASRLVALLEASLWVAVGLAIAQRLGWIAQLPMAYGLTGWTIAGAALLGLGAWIAGACVFGAIARLGSGEWAYLATPVGFYLGCASAARLFCAAAPQARAAGVEPNAAPTPLVIALAAFFVWRALRLAWRRAWTPHAATLVIGAAFAVLLVLAGTWAYTDVLAELARGTVRGVATRGLLVLGLLGGAIAGGWRAGRLHWQPPTLRALVRCLAGGALMGWGSLLIPGSNDGLILVGMPLLRPYAWAAFATMCLVIAAAGALQRCVPARASRIDACADGCGLTSE